MGGIIKWGAIGLGAWWVYSNYFASTVPVAAATPATPAAPPVVPNPNAITGANTLDGIYARMVAAAGSASRGVDQWNTFLATAGNLTPPDPMPLFTAATAGFDRAQLITGPQYWAVMAPALKSQLGLSGIGHYAGLGALYGCGFGGCA
jgi:hypothetical protein